MKIKSIIIQNIGTIKNETIKIDKPLTIFYGEIKQGKTTILNSIRWAFGGSFPKDIITHGEEEASITIEFDNGLISRSFYYNKDLEVVSRPQNIIMNNRKITVNELKRYLNPFLLDQNHLINLKAGNERAQFINEIFQVNTTELDVLLIAKEQKAQSLRASIKAYGEINLKEILKPDFEALEAEKIEVENRLKEQRLMIEKENKAIKDTYEAERQKILNELYAFNTKQESSLTAIEKAKSDLDNIILETKGTIFEKCFDIDCATRLISELPQPEPKKPLIIDLPEPKYIDFDESELININQKIADANVQQVLYDQYLKDEQKYTAKMKAQAELKELESVIKNIRIEKQHAQESINGIIEGLEYKNFQLWYENTAFDMLSTSQLMTLSSKLSSMYTESLGLELIDKGECLGKSVMTLVNKAEKEEKNILVTVVGEKPAEIPENIGVFVVENGEVK